MIVRIILNDKGKKTNRVPWRISSFQVGIPSFALTMNETRCQTSVHLHHRNPFPKLLLTSSHSVLITRTIDALKRFLSLVYDSSTLPFSLNIPNTSFAAYIHQKIGTQVMSQLEHNFYCFQIITNSKSYVNVTILKKKIR